MPSLPRLLTVRVVLLFSCGEVPLVPVSPRVAPSDVAGEPAPWPVAPQSALDAGPLLRHAPPDPPDGPLDAGTHGIDAGEILADAGTVTTEIDAGELGDAGALTVELDAGERVGTGEPDAGAALDAGRISLDAGAEDAGVATSFDAGALTRGDAGTEPSSTETDAGPSPDAGPSQLHAPFGVPDDSSVGRLDRWLLVKPQFVSSYDTTAKTPRWVAWRLDGSWLGSATRASSFRRDSQLPTTVGQARDDDFRNSGFDRGHLCPSADRTRSDPDNDATFVFTNVVPQTRASNAGTWLSLEDDARDWAAAGKTVLIVAGPIFGVTPQHIGAGVPVPLSTFKVIVLLDAADQPVTSQTRIIGVVVPNTTTVSGSWRAHRVSVRSIEQQTGLDFLSQLPRALQDTVETRVDLLP